MSSIKARSKAGKRQAKRAARRGRPLTPNVAREPNGRISRSSKPQEPADKLALSVRARKKGVSVEAARDPRLGSYIGRLNRLGARDGLSNQQYEAANKFIEVRNNWLRAIVSPAAYYEERLALSGASNQEEAVKRDKARYEAMIKALQEAQFDNRQDNLIAALQYLVIEDRELPHMISTLRLSLNALARHFF